MMNLQDINSVKCEIERCTKLLEQSDSLSYAELERGGISPDWIKGRRCLLEDILYQLEEV